MKGLAPAAVEARATDDSSGHRVEHVGGVDVCGSNTWGGCPCSWTFRLRIAATDIDPTYVLYAVAAAVIGGTSLYGGRGKPLHAVLGGIVIAAVYNGIYLIGLGAAATYMVTGVVLLVVCDS